jgi:hypothetical protein
MGQTRSPNQEVQKLLSQLTTQAKQTERREDSRIDISIPVAVIPFVKGQADPGRGFATFTKDISRDGVSIVVNRPLVDDELLIGFPGTQTGFVTATVTYRQPLPLGCQRVGLRMFEMIEPKKQDELAQYLKTEEAAV